jgi:hypothetical protein
LGAIAPLSEQHADFELLDHNDRLRGADKLR